MIRRRTSSSRASVPPTTPLSRMIAKLPVAWNGAAAEVTLRLSRVLAAGDLVIARNHRIGCVAKTEQVCVRGADAPFGDSAPMGAWLGPFAALIVV